MSDRTHADSRVAVIFLSTAIMLLCLPAVAPAQCAMCRRALMSPEGRQMIAAFRSGILVLLAAPFATFAIVARLAIKMQKRRRLSSDPTSPLG